MRRVVSSRFHFVLIAFLGTVCALTGLNGRGETSSPETTRYIAGLDLERFKRTGSNATDPALSPFRILPALTERDQTFHYDFARLTATEERLRGVDRRTVLRVIFARLTLGTKSHHERHLAVLRFLHQSSFHNLIQPMRPNGQPVCDPLVLLELGEMRCGHVNRVAIDLFRAVGYQARLVQAAFHMLAEIWYDNAWHYFDGDIFGNGESVILPDGRIPSMNELANHSERLDALTSFWEPDHTNELRRAGAPYPSYYYFGADAYRKSSVQAEHIVKRATPEQEDGSIDYGWEQYEHVPDPERTLRAIPHRHTPAPPRITGLRVNVEAEQRQITLSWGRDPLAVRYQVFVGRRTRGWSYDGQSLPKELMKWKSPNGPWRPEMYSARFQLPASDLTLVETSDTSVTVGVPRGVPAFFTVMGFDAHGESVGRRLYPLSEELLVP
jgi:hypothetical protein